MPYRERPDIGARISITLIPAAVSIALASAQVVFQDAGQLLAGLALYVGALVAAFTQVAAWRSRLSERKRGHEKPQIRALDEAGAQILLSVAASLLATIGAFVLANLGESPSEFGRRVGVVLTAVTGGLSTVVALSALMTVNLLWDAYVHEGEQSNG